MSAEYTVVAVNDVKEWKGKHGDFVDYILDLDGYGNQVTLTQKPETPEPARGDVLYGDIQKLERTNRKGEPFTVHKFSKEQPNGQTGYTSTTTPPRPTPVRDERGARIERQHSQEMAIRAAIGMNVLPSGGPFIDICNMILKPLTDWFVEDLNKASAAGQVDSLPPGSSEVAEGDTRGEPPAPSQESQEAVSQPLGDGVGADTQQTIKAAYKAYVAAAPDGPAARRELQLFLNANDIPGFEAMSEAQASMVMAFFDDAGGSADGSVPF